ncbi:MAG: hypothetical protein D6694_06265 [Gammaproteobacteria bacterium]|nr:MAG: hypothetical protein D6694_06265 [Gammaproteobacteria bacterium]
MTAVASIADEEPRLAGDMASVRREHVDVEENPLSETKLQYYFPISRMVENYRDGLLSLLQNANIPRNIQEKIENRLLILFDPDDWDFGLDSAPDFASWEGMINFFELQKRFVFPNIILRRDGKFEAIWWKNNYGELRILFHNREEVEITCTKERKVSVLGIRFGRVLSETSRCQIGEIEGRIDVVGNSWPIVMDKMGDRGQTTKRR